MTLRDFIDTAKLDLDEFKRLWELRHAAFPERYPIDMNCGDWYENFDCLDMMRGEK